MKKVFCLSLMTLTLLSLFSGCASTSTTTTSSPDAIQREKVSTVPWNRPQRWEGQGAMGGIGSMLNGR